MLENAQTPACRMDTLLAIFCGSLLLAAYIMHAETALLPCFSSPLQRDDYNHLQNNQDCRAIN